MTRLSHVDLGSAHGAAALAAHLPNLQSLALRLSEVDTSVRTITVECIAPVQQHPLPSVRMPLCLA
jgi:hypothetical protein